MLADPINGFDLRSEVYVDASILWGLVLNPWLSPNRIVIGVQACEFMISQHGGDRGLKLIIPACSWGGSKAISHFSSWGVFFYGSSPRIK